MAFGVPTGGGQSFINQRRNFGFNPRQRAIAQVAGSIGQPSTATPSLSSGLSSPASPSIPAPTLGLPSLGNTGGQPPPEITMPQNPQRSDEFNGFQGRLAVERLANRLPRPTKSSWRRN